ncbi:hypothetical protein As57867_006952, partial [Aphanomyces stellatus]
LVTDDRPIRCFGTAGSPLVWVNGFCVSYTEGKVYHAWTSNYYHDGEEVRGGATTNAVLFFEYDGAFLDRRLAETLVPDAFAVTGLGYFTTNHAWVRTTVDPFSFQGVRADGAKIVVVSFISMLNFNGAKVNMGLQAPNPCYDVLEHLNYGFVNLVSTEYIWVGPQLATYILQFVVVLATLASISHDVSSSILVDLVGATTYSMVLLAASLLGKYYLVFNLSSILLTDGLLSLYVIAVVSFYHNLVITHVWPSKLFLSINYKSLHVGVVHRGLLSVFSLGVTIAEMVLGCYYNRPVQVGSKPTPCHFGTGVCFNQLNTPVLAVMATHALLLTLYGLALAVYARRHPHALVQANWLVGYVSLSVVVSDATPAPPTTFETHCYGTPLDRVVASRYLRVDSQRNKVGSAIPAVMSCGFVVLRSGLLIRFQDYGALVFARMVPL